MHSFERHVVNAIIPYLTVREEETFLNRYLDAAQKEKIITVDQLFQTYQKETGHASSRDSFYYLLKRHGWCTVTPQSEYPKKADAQTITVSKNKIYIQENKEAL